MNNPFQKFSTQLSHSQQPQQQQSPCQPTSEKFGASSCTGCIMRHVNRGFTEGEAKQRCTDRGECGQFETTSGRGGRNTFIVNPI